jgi:hypothetical protein
VRRGCEHGTRAEKGGRKEVRTCPGRYGGGAEISRLSLPFRVLSKDRSLAIGALRPPREAATVGPACASSPAQPSRMRGRTQALTPLCYGT